MSSGTGPGLRETGREAPAPRWEGAPTSTWELRWGVPRFEAWVRVGSTNDRARTLAADGAPPFTLVVAEEQVAGRGREGRSWASPSGLGLWASLVLRSPDLHARLLTPLLVGVAVCRAVETRVPELEVGLKWPNDVLLGRRKLAGVLCEGDLEGTVVVGVGVNVRQRPRDFPPPIRGRAVSLEMAAGREVGRAPLLGEIVSRIRELMDPPAARLSGALAREVAARDRLRGHAVVTHGDRPGVARGIDPDGALRVEREGGRTERVRAGSVRRVT